MVMMTMMVRIMVEAAMLEPELEEWAAALLSPSSMQMTFADVVVATFFFSFHLP